MSESDSGCGGCLAFILFCFLISALIGGINVNGQQYLVGCGCDGVTVETP